MPLHSPLLPILVPLIGAAVPVTYRPRKSQSEMLTVPLTIKLIAIPYVVLVKKILLFPAVPVVVKLPVVNEAVREIVNTPAPELGVIVIELTV
jgi:hypothetical protein